MPGIDPDRDVDVSVSEGMLHIKAEREERSEHKSKMGYRSEFRLERARGERPRSVVSPLPCVLPQPAGHFVVEVGHRSQLQVMHPHAPGRVDHLLEPRIELPPQREGRTAGTSDL